MNHHWKVVSLTGKLPQLLLIANIKALKILKSTSVRIDSGNKNVSLGKHLIKELKAWESSFALQQMWRKRMFNQTAICVISCVSNFLLLRHLKCLSKSYREPLLPSANTAARVTLPLGGERKGAWCCWCVTANSASRVQLEQGMLVLLHMQGCSVWL